MKNLIRKNPNRHPELIKIPNGRRRVKRTLILLEHEDQVDLLEAVEGVQTLRYGGHARNGVERQQGFAGEIVGRQHVVVHDGEQQHGRFLATLFHCHWTALQKDKEKQRRNRSF